jgi:urease accessory protein
VPDTKRAEVDVETMPANPGKAAMRASLQLIFERHGTTGRTVLASSYQDPPLRVVRAFPLEDGSAMAHLHNVSGGLLGGDDLTLSVEIGPGAQAQLTTTGATRIYRQGKSSAITHQRNQIRVAESGLLEYVPDVIIPFAGASFSQHTSIHLASDAGLFWWEILAPGREAHGEVFHYQSVEMQTHVSADGGRIAAERIRLEPKKYDLSSPARMGPHLYCATFYVCRVGLRANAWLDLEAQLRQLAAELPRRGKARWGISTLKAHGLIIRCLADQGSDTLRGLLPMWDAAKHFLYGRHAVPPRKVN